MEYSKKIEDFDFDKLREHAEAYYSTLHRLIEKEAEKEERNLREIFPFLNIK